MKRSYSKLKYLKTVMSFGKSFCWKNQMLCRNAIVLLHGAKVHDKADTHLSTGQRS